jgi:pantoate--beta-alanine ligase
MKILETVAEVKRLRETWRVQGETVGFVPTMGALHKGHVSLIKRSSQECARSLVSIFVNPTQFNDPKDLERYPQPRAQDLELLEHTGASAVFLPPPREIYNDDYRFAVSENEVSGVLCGPTRPGHFAGVLTVVMKLLNIVEPQRAYFGEKDYQQLKLIQDMVRAFFIETEIVPCPTVRENDGLAMSSRNVLLTHDQRKLAPAMYRILKAAPTAEDAIHQLEDVGFVVDYVEEHWGRRFAAAHLGAVRLIDNVEL